nr:MAG TPA: hypothetical protein [Caudoviricetes sp.]
MIKCLLSVLVFICKPTKSENRKQIRDNKRN